MIRWVFQETLSPNRKHGMEKSYYEHINNIADRLNMAIDYLVWGKVIKTDALSSQKMDLVEEFRSLNEEAKVVILKYVRLPCVFEKA